MTGSSESCPREFSLSDFDFTFDEGRIALRPMSPRGDARLLICGPDGGIRDLRVRDLAGEFRANDLLVFNDTKVIPAHLLGVRKREIDGQATEARISVNLLECVEESAPPKAQIWRALIKPAKKIALDEMIDFAPGFHARLVRKEPGEAVLLEFEKAPFAQNLALHGDMPLPPYIEKRRSADARDHQDYQPLLARKEGAVASPTASLHFDEALMNALAARQIRHEMITLHVGGGTFLPVQSEFIAAHKMHSERGVISEAAAKRINAHRQAGGRVIAVGTTVLRLLESAAIGGEIKPFAGATDIFIRPGFRFQIADGLITNFHLPKSTLLILVAAFIGYENMKRVYAHALAGDYRFFSYGDCSLLWRNP